MTAIPAALMADTDEQAIAITLERLNVSDKYVTIRRRIPTGSVFDGN